MRSIIFLYIAALVLSACTSTNKITEKGLAFAKLGDPMPEKGLEAYGGNAVRDTAYDEGGFQWRALIVSYPEGEVFIEEDFGGQALINRIRVETPDLKVNKKLEVGMLWKELLPLKKNWDAVYLSDYQVWDVVFPRKGRIHYLIEEERELNQTDIEKGYKKISMEAKLRAIVIM
ncbi:MAG: hypothetical protein AAF696_25190 [Bacteroidota bacterium]